MGRGCCGEQQRYDPPLPLLGMGGGGAAGGAERLCNYNLGSLPIVISCYTESIFLNLPNKEGDGERERATETDGETGSRRVLSKSI